MSVQKKVCLSDSPTKERRSCTLFFVFQALKPFTRIWRALYADFKIKENGNGVSEIINAVLHNIVINALSHDDNLSRQVIDLPHFAYFCSA